MIWSIDDGQEKRPEGVDEDGIPDPDYAAALGLIPAPLGRRVVATLVDAAVYALLSLPLMIGAMPRIVSLATGARSWYGFVNDPSFIITIVCMAATVVLTLAFTIVQLVLHGKKGFTLGKALTGLRTVNVATLAKPGFGRMLLRGIVLYASSLVPGVGPILFLISPLFDKQRRRGWLDLVGRSWLVDARAGLDPYDVKRMRIARKTLAADPVHEAQALPSLATPVQHGATAVYQPGARVSAGVLGVARPHVPGEQPVVGVASSQQQAAAASAPHPGSAPAAPYRPGELSGAPATPTAPSSPYARPEGVPSAPELQQAGQPIQHAPGVPVAEPVAQQPTPQQPPVAPQWDAQQQAPQAWAPPQQPSAVPPTPPLAPQQAPVPQQSAPAPAQQQPAAAQAPVSPAPASAPASVPEATIMRDELEGADDLEATRIAKPRAIVLELDGGGRVQLGGRVLIGRNPTLQPGEAGTLVPIPDDTRSMSKTHVAIDVEGGTIQIVDRHSTNGTVIVRGGKETRLVGGVPTRAEVGDVLMLGDRRTVISRG